MFPASIIIIVRLLLFRTLLVGFWHRQLYSALGADSHGISCAQHQQGLILTFKSGTSLCTSVSIAFVTEFTHEAPVYFRTFESAMVLPQSSQKRQLLAISAATFAEWLIVILLTTTTLLPYLRRHHLVHGVAGPSRTPNPDFADQRKRNSGKPGSEIDGQSVIDVRDAYSGIVMWPKKQTHTKLIAPSLTSWNQRLVSDRPSNPLVIPFEGVYWFFRQPDVQPPEKSRQAEGSPEMFDIHSTDSRAIFMQAHQNLGTLVGLDCCGRIQVAIRNADRYPTSVSLELILVDTTAPGKPSQSLGRVDIVSNRRWTPDDREQATSETLNFFIPSNSAIHRFDEVTIVFRLGGFRARAAAKIGIDHLTLIPRGL